MVKRSLPRGHIRSATAVMRGEERPGSLRLVGGPGQLSKLGWAYHGIGSQQRSSASGLHRQTFEPSEGRSRKFEEEIDQARGLTGGSWAQESEVGCRAQHALAPCLAGRRPTGSSGRMDRQPLTASGHSNRAT